MIEWFLKLLGFKKVAAPIHCEPLPEFTPPPAPLNDVFLEAIQETYDETYKLELELLNDSKLRDYIKKAVKKMNKDLHADSYSFVHIHPHDVGISSHI